MNLTNGYIDLEHPERDGGATIMAPAEFRKRNAGNINELARKEPRSPMRAGVSQTEQVGIRMNHLSPNMVQYDPPRRKSVAAQPVPFTLNQRKLSHRILAALAHLFI